MGWFNFHNQQATNNAAMEAASQKTMQAAVRQGFCSLLTPKTIGFDDSHGLPDFDPKSTKHDHDVLIRVHAAALNPVDYKAPKALMGEIVGIDLCGAIIAVGEHVPKDKFQVGDVVLGPAKVPSSGSIAEFAVAEAHTLTKVPHGWSVEEAAAIPVVYDTAVTGFEKAGVVKKYQDSNKEVPPLDSILVIGASGGAGMAALHLAKGMGVPRIIGICSKKNAQFCKDNGATHIIPYDEAETLETFLKDNVGGIDLIYDAASGSGGGETYSSDPKFLNLLKAKKDDKTQTQTPSYLVLNGNGTHWLRMAITGKPTSDPRVCLYLADHSTARLDLACDLMKKASMKPVIDTVLDLSAENVTKGYEMLKSRRTKGKIVIAMKVSSN